jgi:hypothetical protein
VESVPVDVTPFTDPVVGDGSGAFAMLAATTPRPRFFGSIFGSNGSAVLNWSDDNADSYHLHVLPQSNGFQILTGDTINTATLVSLSSSGEVTMRTSIEPAEEMASAIDPIGGAIVIALRLIMNSQPTFTYPWRLFLHRIDEKGVPRAPPAMVASDEIGAELIVDFAATTNTAGHVLVVWAVSTARDGKPPFPIRAAWATGAAPVPFVVGTAESVTNLALAPLRDGSVAIATSHAWKYRVPAGRNEPLDVEWLARFARTRIASIRRGRGYAVLLGDPYWDHRAEQKCQSSVDVTLVSSGGSVCGSISLPVPIDSSSACIATLASAAVARDGSVLVRNLETARNPTEGTVYRSFARWWPRLLE